MPIYDYECPDCGIFPDLWAKIAEIKVKCPSCGEYMARLISPCNIVTDVPIMGYWEENIEANPVYIASKQHRKEILADKGLVIKGETPKASQKYLESEAQRIESSPSLKRLYNR